MIYLDSLSGRVRDSALARRLSVTVVYSLLLAYQLLVALNLLACAMILCAYFQVVGREGRGVLAVVHSMLGRSSNMGQHMWGSIWQYTWGSMGATWGSMG